MLFESKIKYLEYRVQGERIKGAGFVKLEARNELCNIRINISGLPSEGMKDSVDNHSVRILLGDGIREEELACLELSGGRANCEFLCLHTKNIKGTGIAYENLETLRIELAPGREVFGALGETQKREVKEREIKEREVKESDAKESDAKERKVHGGYAWETDANEADKREVRETEVNEKKIKERKINEKEPKIREIQSIEEGIAEREVQENAGSPELKSAARLEPVPKATALYDNKWKQLSAIYPHIKPFQDEREYLSLHPQDFVILSEKYFDLIHNSFLLHGYYNYRHLILQRMEKRGEVKYYLGVPGNFYEREKQVAIMFGFESFECLEEPAGNGDYGYYMVPVEL
ncbi:MAG: hypothetical protein IJ833_02300 [Lachnospiraceae bacterium]|nr:hypothetical protein [Lachnospiraceae bacterium]